MSTHDIGSPVSVSPEQPTRHGYGWLLRIWAVVVAFAVVTVVRSVQVGIPIRDPHGSILVSRLAISLGLFVVMVLLDSVWRARRAGLGLTNTVAVLRARWTPGRTTLAVSGLLAYHLVYLCYHNLKSWDAFNRPRDTMLLRWDRWLFLGHSPAVLLHDLLGVHLAAYVLLVIYESFSTLLALGVVAAVVFPERIRNGYVFIASGIFVWILGVASYYAIPSLGPFYSAPQEFAGLPHTMIQHTQATYMAQRAHLLAHPDDPAAFAQVSAFASLHVALTSLLLLMARHYRLRRTTRALALWLPATMVATVYLGWHFAVDDVAGVVIALAGVALGRLLVGRGRDGDDGAHLDRARPRSAR